MAPAGELLHDGHIIIPNKAAPISISNDVSPSLIVLNFASVKASGLYSAGVLGHYFLFTKNVESDLIISTGAPLLAKFKNIDDAVIFGLKTVGSINYFYGVTVAKLIAFNQNPPKDVRATLNESSLLQSWKIPHADLESLTPVVNNDTTKLKAFADVFMSFMPMMKAVKIKSAADAMKYVGYGFERNVKTVLLGMEVAGRKAAASKGPAETAAAGAEAGAVWKALGEKLKLCAPFYAEPFDASIDGRFIIVKLDEATGMPTESTIKNIESDLQYAHLPFPICSLQPRLPSDFNV